MPIPAPVPPWVGFVCATQLRSYRLILGLFCIPGGEIGIKPDIYFYGADGVYGLDLRYCVGISVGQRAKGYAGSAERRRDGYCILGKLAHSVVCVLLRDCQYEIVKHDRRRRRGLSRPRV